MAKVSGASSACARLEASTIGGKCGVLLLSSPTFCYQIELLTARSSFLALGCNEEKFMGQILNSRRKFEGAHESRARQLQRMPSISSPVAATNLVVFSLFLYLEMEDFLATAGNNHDSQLLWLSSSTSCPRFAKFQLMTRSRNEGYISIPTFVISTSLISHNNYRSLQSQKSSYDQAIKGIRAAITMNHDSIKKFSCFCI